MSTGRVDIAAIRAAHPLPDVVTAAGIELRRTGHGFMGCCPFHDDSRASLSVDGVPDRFHCFGCGAAGDVIYFVQRLHRLTFPEAVQHLDGHAPHPPDGALPRRAAASPPATTRPADPTLERAYAINALAWAHYTRPVAHAAAVSHLRRRRGLDLTALEQHLDAPAVGHTGHGWTTLTDHLHQVGVTDDELLALDLAQPTRRGTLIDTLRDRLIVPVTTPDGRIAGLLGRDTSGEARAPKYRNPTRTVSYDKATTCYQPAPTHRRTTTVVLVEGPLDALAVAATAATAGRLGDFTALTAGGVAVRAAHAARAVHLTHGPLVVAMDGDRAGRDGAARWVDWLVLQARMPVLIADLPTGADPADWLAYHGAAGLALLDPRRAGTAGGPRQPGPEIVRATLARSRRNPTSDVAEALQPVLAALQPDQSDALLAGVVAEMTRQGWNPNQVFTRALAARQGAAPEPAYAGPSLT